MKTIKLVDLVSKGGARDAKFAIFYPSGDLYMCTTAAKALMDEAYWAERGYDMREVVAG